MTPTMSTWCSNQLSYNPGFAFLAVSGDYNITVCGKKQQKLAASHEFSLWKASPSSVFQVKTPFSRVI